MHFSLSMYRSLFSLVVFCIFSCPLQVHAGPFLSKPFQPSQNYSADPDSIPYDMPEELTNEEIAAITYKFKCDRYFQKCKTVISETCKLCAQGQFLYSLTGNAALSFLSGPSLLNNADLALSRIWDEIGPTFLKSPSLRSNLREELDQLELLSLLKGRFLTSEHQIRVNGLLTESKATLLEATSQTDLTETKNQQLILKKVLNLPLRPKPVYESSRVIFDQLDDTLKNTFDSSLLQDLYSLAKVIKDRSKMRPVGTQDESDDPETPDRLSVLFLGAPGTGKSLAAEKLAQILDLPFCKLSPKQGSLVRCLITPDSGERAANPILLIDARKGFFQQALKLKSGKTQGFAATLRTLLDPEQHWIMDETLQVKVDISRVTLIIAGDMSLEQLIDESLGQEMTSLFFPKITQGAKLVIATDSFQKLMNKHNVEINESLLTAHSEMIKKIVSYDHSEGARALKKVIHDYVNFLLLKNENPERCPKEFDIQRSFEKTHGLQLLKAKAQAYQALKITQSDG